MPPISSKPCVRSRLEAERAGGAGEGCARGGVRGQVRNGQFQSAQRVSEKDLRRARAPAVRGRRRARRETPRRNAGGAAERGSGSETPPSPRSPCPWSSGQT